MKKKYMLYGLIVFSIAALSIIGYFVFFAKHLTVSRIERSIIDLGQIKKGSEAVASFKISNLGNKDLIISNIVPDCHCMVPEESGAQVIKPGDSGILKLRYDSRILGYFNSVVTIQLNTPKKFEVLIIRGVVK